MKENLDKCHLVLSTTKAFHFQISETVIHTSNSRKLLEVTFNNKLKFEKHIPRVTPYMDLQKKANINKCIFYFSV